MDKPPIGIMPRKLYEIYRAEELSAAIQRYEQVGYRVPEEWRQELAELAIRSL